MSLTGIGLLAALAAGAGAPAPSLPASSSTPASRYVVVVGYNGPVGGDRAPLSWADDDAVRLYQQLLPGAKQAWLLTAFDDDSARLWSREGISARPPTRTELAHVLGEAYWAMRDEAAVGGAELVFAVVGHGDVDKDGEGHVVLADGVFSRTDLERQVIEASPARVNHVVVDACASYHMVARGDGAEALPVDLQVALSPRLHEASVGWERTGVLVATSSAAATHESAAVGGGIFSFVLRSALTGAADVNRDGRVEYGEVAAFVAAANAAVTDPRARLDITARAPRHDPHVAVNDLVNHDPGHWLYLDARSPRHVRVIDARGLPWAEIHREAGVPALVALTGSPYFVIEAADQQAVVVPRERGAYALSSLQFNKAPTSRGADPATAAFFAVPYGRAFVDGFLATSPLAGPAADGDFTVAFASSGAPPMRLPLGELATGSLIAAGTFAVGAAGAAIGNVVALGELDAGFRRTGTLDPAASLRADSFLTAFGVLGAGAVVTGVAGAAFAVAASREEDSP
ncbi:MAG TPA: hypothetical protein VGF99_12245 [Myxococcota bacterium]